jgi:hypothetical protein
LALSVALTAAGCAHDHDVTPVVNTDDPELAALMADGVLPSVMLPAPTMPVAPPRFCGGSFPPPIDEDGGVSIPPSAGDGGPVMVAGSGGGKPTMLAVGSAGRGSSPDAGTAAGGGSGSPGIDPACASQPIGFWRFDDCNTSRADLSDSSFQGNTAFRNVDLICTTGQEGQAVSFAATADLVYAPDQPEFALDNGVTIAAWVKPDAVDHTRTIFRKRDDANSAFALVINNKKFQFIIKLASGRFVSVSTPAKAGTWTHVAASFDGSYLRLYIDGTDVSHAQASGVIARGVGPLLMGNDAAGRRFQGLMDNAWFNTQAAPDTTIMELTCLHQDPSVTVSPQVGPAVAAGTPVTYALSIHNTNAANCTPSSFISFMSLPQDFNVDQSFVFVPPIASGETNTLPFVVTSGEETEPGSYPLTFQVFTQNQGGGGPFGFASSGPTPPSPIGTVTSVRGGPVISPIAPPPSVGAAGGAAPPPGGSTTPTGNVSVQAQYVVAEASGCHVSSQRELTIRDISVVDDPVRTAFTPAASDPRQGAWSFGRLMQRLSPSDADAPDVTEAMLRTFLSPQTINSFMVNTRPPMDTIVLQPWPRTSDGKLDLARAPMRLLAIVNRLDLKDLAKGKAGEGRLVYGILDANGNPLQGTVIFEYFLPADGEAGYLDWANAFHALQAQTFPSEAYNQALQALTDRFTGRGAMPSNPNGSALIDIRTNEIDLSQDFVWQLREFHISPTTGFMAPATVFLTPDASFNSSERLGRFINQNETAVLAETHEVPEVFEGAPFLGGAIFNNIDFWNAPGITNPEARHKFSLNTCNGCHGAETQTAFLQINPRVPGQASVLSGFLNGETVSDPVTGMPRRLAELARRRQLLESAVCSTP